MARYSVLAFLGAFLLFQVELISGQLVLPIYGGGYQIWTTCLLFFQGLLFLGYLYAYFIPRRISSERFVRLHLSLLALSAVVMPWRFPRHAWTGQPAADMLFRLAIFLGLPFLLLSATSTMAQALYAQTPESKCRSPYSIYGWSNLGSVLGLLSYPLVLEPAFNLKTIYLLWRLLFVAYIAAFLPLLRQKYQRLPEAAGPFDDIKPSQAAFLWFLLPATTSAALITATNYVNTMTSPMPLTWMVPLLIYLLSFAAYFLETPHKKHILGSAFLLAAAAALYLAKAPHVTASLMIVCMSNLALMLGCLFLHRELYGIKPGHGLLSRYYLYIAAGGLCGTAVICLGLPILARHVFARYADIDAVLIMFAACALLLFFVRRLAGGRKYAAAAAIVLIGVLISNRPVPGPKTVEALRNFYGVYHVKDDLARGMRIMSHGATPHGMQYLAEGKRSTPLLYYGANSPVRDVFAISAAARDVALVGLGAGDLLPYARPGSRWSIYELDPDVIELARKHFTFLADSQAELRYLVGDARMTLAKEPPLSLDLILLDAFNGANIPFHLLTSEAMQLYRAKLKDGGMLVIHCSSNYFFLPPVLAADTQALGMAGFAKDSDPAAEGGDSPYLHGSQWFAATSDESLAAKLRSAGWSPLRADPSRAWSDGYKNVFRAMRFQ
ncbi:MAG: fused MFS/spermidine synthase [Elusimicrobia bacterium]|nr:fused MFS/spermidine synthase [Elusimicrobiota bacterium]